ncbi:MAG: hypothetical protein P8Y42_07825 [Exilibacterium sp.]
MNPFNQGHTFLDQPKKTLQLLAISPFEKPDLSLCVNWIKSGCMAAEEYGQAPPFLKPNSRHQ